MVDAEAADAALAKRPVAGCFSWRPHDRKESYNVAGTPTTWGNPDWQDNVTTEDAEPVKKLKRAGVNVFEKTNVPLSLADFQSYNEIYGTTNNPYDHERIPGGSSGGSAAALAAGLTGLEIGSDIGGSIRNPAHFCGVFGHKPTHDLLWMRGHSAPGDLRSTPDISVIGPLARSANDLYSAIKVMAGPDEIMSRGYQLNLPELGERSLAELKVGVWKNDEAAPVAQEVEARSISLSPRCETLGRTSPKTPNQTLMPTTVTWFISAYLQSHVASRMPLENYESLKAYVQNELDPEDNSTTAQTLRAQVSSFKEWSQANEMRHQCVGAGTSIFNSTTF